MSMLINCLIFGVIIGIASYLLDPKPQRGNLIGAVILATTGALVGAIFATVTLGFEKNSSEIIPLLVAVFGSLLLLSVGRIFKRSNSDSHSNASRRLL